MSDKKDTNFLYNKITNLEIIVETLYEVVVDSGLTTEEDFDERVRLNIEMVQNEMKKVMEELEKSNENDDESDESSKKEGLNPLFWGKPGEA